MRMVGVVITIVLAVLLGAAGMYIGIGWKYEQGQKACIQAQVERDNLQNTLDLMKKEHQLLQQSYTTLEANHYVALRDNHSKDAQIRNHEHDKLRIMINYGNTLEVQRILLRQPYLATSLYGEASGDQWLHLVARSARPEAGDIAKILLNYGADRHAANRDGETPMSIAQRDGTISVLSVLKTYRPKPLIQVSSNSTAVAVQGPSR